MDDQYGLAYGRNLGLFSSSDQARLRRSVVALAGAGGDGGLLAERLARLGIGELRLADPETFSVENLNRQFGCSEVTIGRNKAEVVAEEVAEAAPWTKVESLPDGINEVNVDAFVEGSGLVIDEMEFTRPELSILLGRAARKAQVPLLTGANIGFGANIFAFHPQGRTIEAHYGLKGGKVDETPSVYSAAKALCPRVPPYVSYQVFADVVAERAPVPSVSQAVAAVAAAVSHEASAYLAGRQDLVYVPHYLELDLMRRSFRRRRASTFAFVMSAMRVRLRPAGSHAV